MSSVFIGVSSCVLAVGSVCCSYAGRHTHCREYCQAIFRTDSSPTVSQINTVKEYCQSISPQLISCVANYTKSYPTRSPIDSENTSYTLHSKTTHLIINTVHISLIYQTQKHMCDGLGKFCREILGEKIMQNGLLTNALCQ